MDETKGKIIELFKKKGSEISTKEILVYVYPESEDLLNKSDKDSKRKIAQWHRKLLYHINELVERGILRFSRFGEKGHKFFVLDIGDNEEVTEFSARYKKKLVISKPAMPAMPIESYEHQGMVLKFETNSWIDKLNSIVIMCKKAGNISEINNVFESSLSIVNDCVCFEDFDETINKTEETEIINFLEKINSECSDYGKKVSCIINISNVNREKFKKILETVLGFKKDIINFIYNMSSEELQEQFGILNEILMLYIKNKKIIYIKNKRMYKAPYFIGNAGPYCLTEKAWNERKDVVCIACSQSSLIVDVEKFYSLYGLDSEKFSQVMINISKSFLSANSIQRRKSEDYFKTIVRLNKPYEKEFLELSRNYIRFWNFGLSQPGIDQSLVLNMISEAKKKINDFSGAEETIYKSCGMPTRFKIALSCAFKGSEEKLSPAKYKRFEIHGLDDFYKSKTKKELVEKENVSLMFDGGNDVTFHRTGNFSSEEIIREFSVIMNAYKIPLFSYNFENMKGDTKITSYFK